MQPNLSHSERWVRGVTGLVAVFLGTLSAPAAAWATIAWIIGGVLVLTGVAGYCPVYDRLGFNSLEAENNDPDRWGGSGYG